jgi:hypothetical protein
MMLFGKRDKQIFAQPPVNKGTQMIDLDDL